MNFDFCLDWNDSCTAEMSLVWVEGNNHTQIERNVVVCMKRHLRSFQPRVWVSLSLRLYQYATHGLKHNSTVFYHGVAACTVLRVFPIPKHISALPIISIIKLFVIFVIEDMALKMMTASWIVQHNQCFHLLLQCNTYVMMLNVYTRIIAGTFGPVIMQYMSACCRLCRIFHVHLGK